MQAASPEDPAVSQVLARAGAGNQCLIMEITPGGEFTPRRAPGASAPPVRGLLLARSIQKAGCLYCWQQHASCRPPT